MEITMNNQFNNTSAIASVASDTENSANIGQAPDAARYHAEQNSNFNQLFAEYAGAVRNTRAARLGIGDSEKVSETFRVASNLNDGQGVLVKFVNGAVIVNDRKSASAEIYVNSQWECEGYLKALTDLHTGRFVHVGIGYRTYKANPSGTVKNFVAITASYPDKDDMAGAFAPKTGYVTLDWTEGVYSIGISVTEKPAKEDYDLDCKASWDLFHFDYVQYVKHLALDNILSGKKIMIMPRLHQKEEGKLVLDENGNTMVDEVASTRFLNKYAGAFRLSGEEAKFYVKTNIETYVSKKVDRIVMKDVRSANIPAEKYEEMSKGLSFSVIVDGHAEKMYLSALSGQTVRIYGRTSDVVVKAEMVVDEKGIEYLTAMYLNGFISQGLRKVELI
jgi:hypothetical protein